MNVSFSERISFIYEVSKNGMKEAVKKTGIDKKQAEELWEWYKKEGCKPLVLYQNRNEWIEIKGEEGNAEEVEKLGLIEKGRSIVKFYSKIYSIRREGLYRFILIPESIRNLISLRDESSLVPLLASLSNLHIHGNRNDGDNVEKLKGKLRTQPWVSIICWTISNLAKKILEEESFSIRMVETLTSENWNTYDNSHVLLEVFYPKRQKWILVDLDMGFLFKKNGKFLNTYEFWKCIKEEIKPEFFILSKKEMDPFFLATNGFNYSLGSRWIFRDLEMKWNWYKRVFQTIGIYNIEKRKYTFFGPKHKIKEYYGEDINILSETEWVKKFYKI